ncbi:hypothetical protein [Micromonospora chalcea]|uniref:hypothetical protein n=1 Tax=Micromonospora chalcea TaxID=1874 RepID=UPI003D738322
MAYVLVEHVTDPERAARALEDRGGTYRAEGMRARGAGTFVMTDPDDLGSDRRRAESALGMYRSTWEVPGATVHLRLDYDPDWSKQNAAVAEAMAAAWRERDRRRMAVVPAANAFAAAYYGWGSGHDLADPIDREWSPAGRRNFSDRARLLMNAVAGLRLRGSAPAEHVLIAAVEQGRVDADDERPEPFNGRYVVGTALEVAYGLSYVMHRHGEPHYDWLTEAIKAGVAGNA